MNLPSPLRPLAPVLVVIVGLMTIEYVLLIVGEWHDGNAWSLAVRAGGLVATLLCGFWMRQRLASVKKRIEEEGRTALARMTADDLPPVCAGFEKRCEEFVWMAFNQNGAPRYCLRCWAASVERRLS